MATIYVAAGDRVSTGPVRLFVQSCYKCGIVFGMPDDYDTQRRRDHETWYCPNGHGQVYKGPTPEERELKQARTALAEVRADLARESSIRTTVERSRAAYRGQLTRVRRKIELGQCPECRQTFPDLARHMHEAHIDLIGAEVEE